MPTSEQVSELHELFPNLTINNGHGEISATELPSALKVCGVDIPNYKLREHLQKYGDPKFLTYTQFTELADELTKEKNAEAHGWIKNIGSATNTYEIKSAAEQGVDDIKHTIRIEEELAFLNWINSNLSEDPDLKRHLPVSNNDGDLYKKIQDGLVICKLINLAVPGTIDERAVNKKNLNTYTKLENLTLCLMSSQAIGCNIVNIDGDDLSKGRPHLVLGLLWQIIRIGLFREIDLVHVPGLFRLLREGETLDDLRRLTPEQILIRWVNYHLERAGVNRHLSNFTSDVNDSIIYTHLLHQIAPNGSGVGLSPLNVQDGLHRADAMLNEADKISCREFVRPEDVVKGNYKLNLAFVANLFNKYPNLPEPDAEELPVLEDVVEETREEKTYRNWMNSLGVDPYVNYLYSDLQNGLVIFQLYDQIRPGVVNWKRVVVKFRKLQAMMDQILNCGYAVELGKQMHFSLVGIEGKDIYDGNQTLTLALVWQLMRAYTLTVLAQCTQTGDRLATDREIINWVNEKLESCGKQSRIKSFQDSSIADARPVLDLIESIKPGIINYELIQHGSQEANLANAKYAITSARKIGAKIYALPEDVAEVKPKMVMTVFACLMARDFMPQMKCNESSVHSNGTSNGHH